MVDASYYTTIVYTREGSGKAKQQIVLTGTSTAVVRVLRLHGSSRAMKHDGGGVRYSSLCAL